MSAAPERAGRLLRAAQGQAPAGRPGRTRSRPLLPRLRLPAAGPVDPAALFPDAGDASRLEIGFGGGEHLAAQARAEPADRLHRLRAVRQRRRQAAARDRGEQAATTSASGTGTRPSCCRGSPPASLDRVYLLYPDPWPKRRQRKRRFVSDETLAALARVVRPGGACRFATDIDDYAGWDARPGPALARLALDRRGDPTTGAALGGLARHPLRGQGLGAGPQARLPALRADLNTERGLAHSVKPPTPAHGWPSTSSARQDRPLVGANAAARPGPDDQAIPAHAPAGRPARRSASHSGR